MSFTTKLNPKNPKVLELENQGYEVTSEKTGILNGRKTKKITTEKTKSGTLERIARGAAWMTMNATVVGTLLNFDEEYRQETIIPAVYGSNKKVIYEDLNEPEIINEEIVGCDPRKSESVRSFLEKNRSQWEGREASGHNFMVGKGRSGISFFYFIPNGDVSKAYSVKFWKTKNGESVLNSKKQLLAIRDYCAAYNDIETQWKEKLPELAASLVKLRKGTSNEITQDQAIEILRKQHKTIVVDRRNESARIYGPYDRNKLNPDDYQTGVWIKLSEDTIKEIDKNHGKSMEYKEPLAGHPPKEPAKDPFADLLRGRGDPQQQSVTPPTGKGKRPLPPHPTQPGAIPPRPPVNLPEWRRDEAPQGTPESTSDRENVIIESASDSE